ncbi:SRPBCC domain-containing protein, partial [Amycolatopsis acidiphila]
TWDDGTQRDWGEILAWEPPSGFTMTWLVTPTATEVELSFKELGPALTRVAVEHRGWEKLSDEELRAACALPGGYSGGAHARGWAAILGRLAEACEGAE